MTVILFAVYIVCMYIAPKLIINHDNLCAY